MKDSDIILRGLCAASSRLQEVESLAKKAGMTELAMYTRRAGNIVLDSIGKLITRQVPVDGGAS